MVKIENKKAAMEMSVGTIVTIVLLVTVLVLGLVLVRTVFTTGTDAVDQIDSAIQQEINKLFADENKNLIVYPASRDITLERGDTPRGFAFSLKNPEDEESAEFTYETIVQDLDCGSSFTEEDASDMIIAGSGGFSLGPGDTLDVPRLVRFDVPESAPLCTIVYDLQITQTSGDYNTAAQIFVTIE